MLCHRTTSKYRMGLGMWWLYPGCLDVVTPHNVQILIGIRAVAVISRGFDVVSSHNVQVEHRIRDVEAISGGLMLCHRATFKYRLGRWWLYPGVSMLCHRTTSK